MKPPDLSALDHRLETEVHEGDVRAAGEIAAPPVSVADPVPPLATQPAAAKPASHTRSALNDGVPMWKTFAAFLGPMLLSNILQSLSGTLNNVYVGQMIGVGALAAVSSFFPMMFFFIAFTIGLGAGASVLIGQAWGARETGKVKAIAGTTLTVGIAFGLLVAVFGGSFTQPLLAALGTPTLSTVFRILKSMRIAWAKVASGASGLFVLRSRKPSQVVATTKDTTVAAAPLATPSCGRPPQPRISAGVSTRPMPVEMASV